MIGIGPKDKWEYYLEKLSRAALIETVIEMQFFMRACGHASYDREGMVEVLARCKKYGKWTSDAARHQRWRDDPESEIDRNIRRLKAAKKAARTKKRAAQLAKRKQA
jgi:hypothetical protein